jgi:hypothetical protein
MAGSHHQSLIPLKMHCLIIEPALIIITGGGVHTNSGGKLRKSNINKIKKYHGNLGECCVESAVGDFY